MKSKLFILMFVCIFLVTPLISAFEFDNVGSYNEETKTMTIENVFGLGETIAEIELITPLNYHVPRGYQKVAEFEVRANDDYKNAFKELELFDKKKGMKKFTRDYDYKKLSYETVIVDDYENVLIGYSSNGSAIYESQKVGSHEEQREVWTKLTPADFKKNDVIRIGIFTDVQKGDKVEWIPNLFGVRIDEWAVWTEDLNTNLVSFYKLNATSGVVIDSVGANNGTNNGATRGVAGIINNSFDFETSEVDYVEIDDGTGTINTITDTVSISVWVKKESSSSYHIISGTLGGWGIYTYADNTFAFGKVGVDEAARSTGTIPNGVWTHLAVTYDGVANEVRLYKNGTLDAGSPDAYSTTFSTGLAYDIGRYQPASPSTFDGLIDELGIWNRSLNSTEISDLYNNGNGITYQGIFSPIVTLNIPANNTVQSTNNLTFNCSSISSKSILNLSLIINDIINYTVFNTTANQDLSLEQTLNFSEGDYNWTCNTFDEDDNEGTTETRIFSIDTTLPNVSLSSPTGDQGTFVSGINLTLSWNVSDTNLASCFYDYGGSNTTVTCSDNSTNLTVTDSSLISLKFYANDTSGNLASDNTSWSYSFVEKNVTFNINVSETSLQNFTLELTTDVDVLSISSILNYNGTEDISTSSCVESNCTLFNSLDIPLVVSGESELKPFFWNFTIFNGSDSINIATSTRTQNVSRIRLELCNSTWTTQTLNFTVFDEQNISRISPYEFDGTFDFWAGSGTIMRNNSFSYNVTEMNLCLSPNITLEMDATINYGESSNDSEYTDRFYYFDGYEINNISQDIDMYLLKSIEATSFILKVQDENLLPISDALIEIHRYYPGEGIFRIVQIAKTDDNGQSIGFFETEIIDYKFIIKKEGETLLETGQQKVIPETSPYTLTFNTGENLEEPWSSQEDIINLNSTLVWDSTTGIVSYTYIDSSNNFTLSRLLVQQQSFVNSTSYVTICNDTSSLSSSTITCNVGNTSGFYIAKSFITRTGTALDKQITFQIETLSSVAGLVGLFYGWFLIVIAVFMFKFNEIAGIWATTLTIFFINLMGLIKFGAVFVTAIFGIAIILTWVMER